MFPVIYKTWRWRRQNFTFQPRLGHSFFHRKNETETARKSLAPWLKIGSFEPGNLNHIHNTELLRALFVLQICSIDKLVDNSHQFLNAMLATGNFGEALLRKTFFNQFVGGDDFLTMSNAVNSLQNRGLHLMVAPVLEEDVDSEKTRELDYDKNLESLLQLVDLVHDLGNDHGILQFKLSALMSTKILKRFYPYFKQYWSDSQVLAKFLEEQMQLGEFKNELSVLNQGISRARHLIRHAKEQRISLLTDAEFHSCKYSISTIALLLMLEHNSSDHRVLGNTIQAYFKDSVHNAKIEFDSLTQFLREPWFGKIVRGAYMDRERSLAKKYGFDSPICDSYTHTSLSYDEILEDMMTSESHISSNSRIILATHNEKSIRKVAHKMKQLNMNSNTIRFAQIYGMGDYISVPLISSGYFVYKSIPYGPMDRVLPYLSRRVSENRSVLRGAREERVMLQREITTRLRNFLNYHQL